MTAARTILGLSAAIFLLVGGYYLARPTEGAALVGITLDTALGVSDIRAVYGGLDFAVGSLILYCLLRSRLADGLTIQTFVFGGLALARMIGIALDRPTESLATTLFAVESAGCILGIVGLRAVRRRTTD